MLTVATNSGANAKKSPPPAGNLTATVLALPLLVLGTACAPPAIDGSGNNLGDPSMGAVDTALLRLMPSDYSDGDKGMAGAHRESPRVVSNEVCDQPGLIPNDMRASDMVWQWGQFLDHDIDLSEVAEPHEPADIPVPLGDPFFDPFFTGTETIGFERTVYEPGSSPRQQINQITAWIDGSNVYGSDPVRAAALRTNDGTGRLATSAGNLLPFNTLGLPNAGGTDDTLFLAGDVRANEQVYLTSMHTLFVREHNFWAHLIRSKLRDLDGESIYQAARAIVTAELQIITYKEFLPVLLGPDAIPPYTAYDDSIDASIANEFSTAAFRFGHSMLSPTLLRLDRFGDESEYGHLELRDAFFRPDRLTNEGGIEPTLRGLTKQEAQRVDPFIIDDVRNFLFGPPGAGGFDLASLNIQRGRDHGLPSYNDMRDALGMGRATDFSDVSSNPEIQSRLAAAYDNVDDIDLWVGGLAEDHVPGALVGPLVHKIVSDQFRRLRDGDRYWYKRTLPPMLTRYLEQQGRLKKVIVRNTTIRGREIAHNPFRVPEDHGGHGGGHGGPGGDPDWHPAK